MTPSPPSSFNLHDPALISVLDELPLWSAPFGIKLLDKVVPKKNMKVLDIGFGTGFPLIELAMRLGETCKIYGIDPWQAAADRAMEKIRVFGINNIDILTPVETQNFMPFPLSDNSIDLVVSNNGLNNVEDLDQALSECARVLKPGGQLVFTMNLDDTMIEFYDIMRKVLSGHQLELAIAEMEAHIYKKRKPLEEVVVMLLDHGFTIKTTDLDKFSYTFTDGTTMFRHFFIRLAFLDAWKAIVPVEKQDLIFAEIETTINQMSEKEGCFRLSVPFVVIDALKK
jgi:arsenite methyltransferase